jgi:AcrR family transcriptional regulator
MITEPDVDHSETAESGETGSGKRLTAAQWTEICTLWELGEVKIDELAKRFDVSRQSIMRHFKKNGIVRNSRKSDVRTAIVAGVASATTSAVIANFADKRKQRIEDTREAHYQAADYLSRLTNKLITDALRASKPVSSIKEDIKALRMASAIQEQSFRIRIDVLNADQEIDENELPTLTIEDLTDEDIASIQTKTSDDDLGDEDLLEAFDDTDEGDDADHP